jgi:hypothetical protein
MGNMSDIQQMEVGEPFAVGPFELLPDTLMILSGAVFRDMLPAVSHGAKRGRKPRPNPGYANSVYLSQEEVDSNPVMTLSPAEYRTLRLHLQGWKTCDIAKFFRVTEAAIHMRLKQHRVRAAKAYLMESLDEDISSLMGGALEAYRDGVRKTEDIDTRIKAADRIFRLNGKGLAKREDKPKEGDMSAAQFMSSLLKNIDAKININVGNSDSRDITPDSETKSLDGHLRGSGYATDVEDCE